MMIDAVLLENTWQFNVQTLSFVFSFRNTFRRL